MTHYFRRSAQVLSAVFMLGLIASQASANLCFGQRNNVPGSGSDGENLSCGRVGFTATAGTATAAIVGGSVQLSALKIAGAANNGMGIEGFDGSGTIVCSALDLTTTGGDVDDICPAGVVQWQGSTSYQ